MPEFSQLLDKYLRNELEGQELQDFLQLAQQPEHAKTLREEILLHLQHNDAGFLYVQDDLDLLFGQMLQKSEVQPTASAVIPLNDISPVVSRWRLWMKLAAACLVMGLGIGIYMWSHSYQQQPAPATVKQVQPKAHDVAPGTDKAILTLSDGTKINLSDVADGVVAQQGNTALFKKTAGELVYKASNTKGLTTAFNTVATPRGGQYKLVLPDGTGVWLNAGSSITYPVIFSGTERPISMEGEAYFEVTPNKKQPFIVKSNGMQVHVTGTHFNVNAYADEAGIKTTLLEGAVTVKKGAATASLRPGQQVTITNESMGPINTTDVEDVVAWKNGLFSFNGDDLAAIMRQLARWYNLEVKYEGVVSKRRFAGKVFRSLSLTETLKVLELSNIHFHINGNTLTVIP